jgi:hypothetical protein
MFDDEEYLPFSHVMIWALLAGYGGGNNTAWATATEIARRETFRNDDDITDTIEELENEGLVATQSLTVKGNIEHYWRNRPDLAPPIPFDKAHRAELVEWLSFLKKYKTLREVTSSDDFRKFHQIAGAVGYKLSVTKPEILRAGLDKYLSNFRENKLETTGSRQPWGYVRQLERMNELLNAKQRDYGNKLTISGEDIREEEKYKIRPMETLLMLSNEGSLLIHELGMDYQDNAWGVEDGDEKNLSGIFFVRVELTGKPLKSKGYHSRHFPKQALTAKITFTPENYDRKRGVLHITGIGNIKISSHGSAHRPLIKNSTSRTGKMYDQCWLLVCVFKNVNTIRNGATFSAITSVSTTYSQGISRSKIKNLVYEINRKATEQQGIESLIKISHDKVFVNSSYL